MGDVDATQIAAYHGQYGHHGFWRCFSPHGPRPGRQRRAPHREQGHRYPSADLRPYFEANREFILRHITDSLTLLQNNPKIELQNHVCSWTTTESSPSKPSRAATKTPWPNSAARSSKPTACSPGRSASTARGSPRPCAPAIGIRPALRPPASPATWPKPTTLSIPPKTTTATFPIRLASISASTPVLWIAIPVFRHAAQ